MVANTATGQQQRRSAFAGLNFIKAALCPLEFNAIKTGSTNAWTTSSPNPSPPAPVTNCHGYCVWRKTATASVTASWTSRDSSPSASAIRTSCSATGYGYRKSAPWVLFTGGPSASGNHLGRTHSHQKLDGVTWLISLVSTFGMRDCTKKPNHSTGVLWKSLLRRSEKIIQMYSTS